MNEQTQNTGTQNHTGTELPKKEEGHRMTTKTATARSSITDSHAEHKKIIDAEEEQKKKLQSDEERLEVDCRMLTTKGIPKLLDETGMRNELLMIVETAAKTIRSIILRAADRTEREPDSFIEEWLEIHLFFHEPYHIKVTIKGEEENVKN